MTATTQNISLHIFAHGRVQGVGFRYNTLRIAKRYTLTGWVRNCADGSVEIIAQGTEEKLHAFMEQLKTHTHPARVDYIHSSRIPLTAYTDFTITR